MKKNDYKKGSSFLAALPYALIALVLAAVAVIAMHA